MNSVVVSNASIVACTTSDKYIEKRLQAFGPLQFDWAIVEEGKVLPFQKLLAQ